MGKQNRANYKLDCKAKIRELPLVDSRISFSLIVNLLSRHFHKAA